MLDSQATIFPVLGVLFFTFLPGNISSPSDLSIVIYYDRHHGRMTGTHPGEFLSSIKAWKSCHLEK